MPKKEVKEDTNKNDKKLEKDKKGLGRKIFDIAFWVIIVCLAFIWLIDFIKVENNKEPIFCLSEKTHEFEDGKVNECVGLGYKIYDYKRDSITGHQFGPIFIKMKK